MNYLASPPLVVAYALAGTMDIDLTNEPLGHRQRRQAGLPEGHLAIGARSRRPRWARRVDSAHVQAAATPACSRATSTGRPSTCRRTRSIAWDADLDLRAQPAVLRGHDHDARQRRATSAAPACWPCSATRSPPTTSRRPATSPSPAPPAKYLMAQGVQPADFNQYGARRGNHEVMMRGTFANIRLRNLLLPGTEGGVTLHLPVGRADVDLRRGDAATRPRARRWSCSPARSTAPAHRATGPPRARCCSACRP